MSIICFVKSKLPIVIFLSALYVCTANAESIVLSGATIFTGPSVTPIESGNLLITDDIITAVDSESVPSDTKTIDLSGKFLTAGFWNCHVHYLFKSSDTLPGNESRLEILLADMFLKWGFVNTIDTGSYPGILFPIHNAIEAGQVVGPKIYRMGGSFVPKDGSPFYIAPTRLPEFTSTEQAAELVRIALNTGLDGIKMFTGSWATPKAVVLMEPEHVNTAVTVARKRGKLTFAHPSDSDGARIAIEAGVDVLAHAFPAELNGPWDKSLPARMKQLGTSFIPTLKLFRHDMSRIGFPSHIIDQVENNAIDQLRAIHQQDNRVLFGTDVGYMQESDTTVEFSLMGKAGLDFNDILASLTTAPAELLNVSDHQGSIQESYQADLVVLNSDPRLDVTAFADVEMVIKGGKIVYQR
jgi:imidazolonepropionase-like amidohydrolase